MSKTEQTALLVKELQGHLASKGILAIYGGRKGHGFWLYPTSPEAISRYRLAHGYTDDMGPALRNDGKKSGNPGFWMFEDALTYS